jgi:hypothetical protein
LRIADWLTGVPPSAFIRRLESAVRVPQSAINWLGT